MGREEADPYAQQGSLRSTWRMEEAVSWFPNPEPGPRGCCHENTSPPHGRMTSMWLRACFQRACVVANQYQEGAVSGDMNMTMGTVEPRKPRRQSWAIGAVML